MIYSDVISNSFRSFVKLIKSIILNSINSDKIGYIYDHRNDNEGAMTN